VQVARIFLDKPTFYHEGNFVLLRDQRLVNLINNLIARFHKQIPFEGNVEEWKSVTLRVIINGEAVFLWVNTCDFLIHYCECLLGPHNMTDIDVFKACLQIEEL
jgi:hypothetical protein